MVEITKKFFDKNWSNLFTWANRLFWAAAVGCGIIFTFIANAGGVPALSSAHQDYVTTEDIRELKAVFKSNRNEIIETIKEDRAYSISQNSELRKQVSTINEQMLSSSIELGRISREFNQNFLTLQGLIIKNGVQKSRNP